MSNIIDLFARDDAAVQGTALCLECKHEWQAVCPDPDIWLECPSCHLHKGRFKHPYAPVGGSLWICNCGNNLFHITLDGYFCPNCGTKTGVDGPEKTPRV